MQVGLGGKRAAEVRIYNPATSCGGRIVPESFAASRTIQAVSIVGLSGFGSSDSMPRVLRVTAMNLGCVHCQWSPANLLVDNLMRLRGHPCEIDRLKNSLRFIDVLVTNSFSCQLGPVR